MSDELTKLFAQMMEQGQKMAAAFAPALDGVDVKGHA
jgi:4-carboxymuconolactone decarboxylase